MRISLLSSAAVSYTHLDVYKRQALELAEMMVKNTSPFGLRLTKESMQSSVDGNSFDTQIKMENRNQVVATETQDAYRGTRKMNPKLREDVKAHPENYTFSNH